MLVELWLLKLGFRLNCDYEGRDFDPGRKIMSFREFTDLPPNKDFYEEEQNWMKVSKISVILEVYFKVSMSCFICNGICFNCLTNCIEESLSFKISN